MGNSHFHFFHVRVSGGVVAVLTVRVPPTTHEKPIATGGERAMGIRSTKGKTMNANVKPVLLVSRNVILLGLWLESTSIITINLTMMLLMRG